MNRRFVIAGTGTGVGKTVFAAALVGALDGSYWKPIQAGFEPETDSQRVARLSGLPIHRILPEAYLLRTPASPHFAAERDGLEIDTSRLVPPAVSGPLIIEGAGGLMVPLTPATLQVDLFASWGLSVILVAPTSLGTINHSLLSLEALATRRIAVHGIAFIGAAVPSSEDAICRLGAVRRLGRLPVVEPLEAETLRTAFAAQFRVEDFA